MPRVVFETGGGMILDAKNGPEAFFTSASSSGGRVPTPVHLPVSTMKRFTVAI